MACHGTVRAGRRLTARRDERPAAPDGGHAPLRPVQPRPPHLRGAEAGRHRTPVRAALGRNPQEMHPRRAVVARVQHSKPGDVERAARPTPRSNTTSAPGASQPPAASSASARLAQALGVGRVEEGQVEGRAVAARPHAQVGGVAAVHPGRGRTGRAPRCCRGSRRARPRRSPRTGRRPRPRDRASNPRAPEPANRSITRAPASPGAQGACSRMLNTAWRARSPVGRVAQARAARPGPCRGTGRRRCASSRPGRARAGPRRFARGLAAGPRAGLAGLAQPALVGLLGSGWSVVRGLILALRPRPRALDFLGGLRTGRACGLRFLGREPGVPAVRGPARTGSGTADRPAAGRGRGAGRRSPLGQVLAARCSSASCSRITRGPTSSTSPAPGCPARTARRPGGSAGSPSGPAPPAPGGPRGSCPRSG